MSRYQSNALTQNFRDKIENTSHRKKNQLGKFKDDF
jgi:hypothetical protein